MNKIWDHPWFIPTLVFIVLSGTFYALQRMLSKAEQEEQQLCMKDGKLNCVCVLDKAQTYPLDDTVQKLLYVCNSVKETP
jgi:hypothetical protein